MSRTPLLIKEGYNVNKQAEKEAYKAQRMQTDADEIKLKNTILSVVYPVLTLVITAFIKYGLLN